VGGRQSHPHLATVPELETRLSFELVLVGRGVGDAEALDDDGPAKLAGSAGVEVLGGLHLALCGSGDVRELCEVDAHLPLVGHGTVLPLLLRGFLSEIVEVDRDVDLEGIDRSLSVGRAAGSGVEGAGQDDEDRDTRNERTHGFLLSRNGKWRVG